MKKITHIIRVKKFKPKYEIYEVSDNTTKFVESFNKYEDQLKKFSFTRIVLSSVLCVEGRRDLPFDKKIKINENEFYFSHQILSNTNELHFSPAIIDKNQLKQFWLDEEEYSNLVKPLIDKTKDKVECIISEKSCFLIKKNENIELQDGKIINIFKLNKYGFIDNELSKQQSLSQNNKSLSGFLINNNISSVPKIITKKYTKFNKLWISILFVFIFLNLLLLIPKFFPLTELKVNYLLNNFQLKKITNSEKIFEQEMLISKNLNKDIPYYIIKINNMIETMSEDLIQNLLALELISNDKLIIKFKNYDIEKINKFINKNNILKQETNIKNDILLLTVEF
tara:strand:+ start:2128 stop:3144 length:1017 start_codon:yes stop_codon:yes gene_type:complete